MADDKTKDNSSWADKTAGALLDPNNQKKAGGWVVDSMLFPVFGPLQGVLKATHYIAGDGSVIGNKAGALDNGITNVNHKIGETTVGVAQWGVDHGTRQEVRIYDQKTPGGHSAVYAQAIGVDGKAVPNVMPVVIAADKTVKQVMENKDKYEKDFHISVTDKNQGLAGKLADMVKEHPYATMAIGAGLLVSTALGLNIPNKILGFAANLAGGGPVGGWIVDKLAGVASIGVGAALFGAGLSSALGKTSGIDKLVEMVDGKQEAFVPNGAKVDEVKKTAAVDNNKVPALETAVGKDGELSGDEMLVAANIARINVNAAGGWAAAVGSKTDKPQAQTIQSIAATGVDRDAAAARVIG